MATVPPLRASVVVLATVLGACSPGAGRPGDPSPAPARPALAGAEQAPAPGRFEGELVGRIRGTVGRPFGIGVSSAGEALVLQLDTRSVSRFGPADSAVVGSVSVGESPIDVTITRDGRRALVTMLGGSSVYEVDVERGRALGSATVGARHHRIELSLDEGAYYVLSMDGVVRRVARASSEIESSLALGPVLRGISLHRAARSIAVSGGDAVWLLDGEALEVGAKRVVGAGAQEVVHSGDGTRVFVALESSGTILALDARTLEVVDSLRLTIPEFAPFGMALAADGRTLLVSSPQTGVVGVLDTRPLRARRLIPVGGTPRRIAFTADGRTAYVANERGWVDVVR